MGEQFDGLQGIDRGFRERGVKRSLLAKGHGMPMILAAVDQAHLASSLACSVGVMAAAIVLAGALVGTVHGAALVRLAQTGLPPPRE